MIKRFKQGSAFADQVSIFSSPREKANSLHNSSDYPEETARIGVFIFLLILLPLFLLTRIFFLQVVNGSYYRNLSEQNRIVEKVLPAPRGVITDRNGEILARNIPLYRQKITKNSFSLVDREEALALETKGGTEAARLETISGREYPFSAEFAHVLGYLGEVTKEELDKQEAHCYLAGNISCNPYRLGDFSGKMGIEKQYETVLRGHDGKELVEVDAGGKVIRSLGRVGPISGTNLSLSIDYSLQKIAYNALLEVVNNERSTAGKIIKGAVIVSNPQNGEILALVSVPSFDPNAFITYKNHDQNDTNEIGKEEKVRDYLTNPSLPLFNRTIGGVYPPGSTFKLVVASAGLESGKITPETVIEDTGVIKIGPYQFPNWAFLKSGTKDGLVTLTTALKRSNDIYFYKAGEATGFSNLQTWAHTFGLGKPSGIDLEGEAGGLVPTEKWKMENIKDQWYLGDTYHLSIGQGYLLVTPLQVNAWTNVIGNGGKLCRPHLLKSQISNLKSQKQMSNIKSDDCREIGLKQSTVETIKEGMEMACNEGGTAWPLFNFTVKSPRALEPKKIDLACKTGTAEYGDPEKRTHAWFTVFAPAQKPEVSITVLVEGGGEGSDVSTYVAKKILEEWFGR